MPDNGDPGRHDALADWLAAELDRLEPGERLPTMREIMRRFRTSQRKVEAALAPHVASGRVRAKRGAGLTVATPAAETDDWEADVLLLYRLSDSRLARNLLFEIERRMKSRGVAIMLLGFSDESRALSILSRLGRFRVCLLQTHFDAIPLAFLAALSEHASSLVIDGISATGIAADGVGTNWREALEIAHRHLRGRGHRRIAFLTSAHSARQIAMARREYRRLSEAAGTGTGWLIEIDALPGSYTITDVAGRLAATRGPDGSLPFSALITWGMVEGYLLDRALTDSGIRLGADLSVVMLGSVDFQSEHIGRFDTVGNSNAEKIDAFERVLRSRLEAGGPPSDIHYLPIRMRSFGSVEDGPG